MNALAALALAAAAFAREPYSPARLSLMREVTEARVSPDGRQAAFVTDITGALEVWSVPTAGGWPTQLSALGEQASDVRFSPDGRKIAFTSDFGGDERPDIYVVDAEGGETEDVTASTQAETSPRFSPDGGRLAYLADPGQPFLFQLMVVDLATKKKTQLTRESVNLHDPVWAPDNRTIAALRSGDDAAGEVLLVDSLTGETRSIAPPLAGGLIIPEDFSADSRSLLCRARNERGFLQLYLLDVGTGRGGFIGYDDWDVDQAVFHPLAGIFFTRNEGGASALYRMLGPDAQPEQLLKASGRIEDFDLDRRGERAVYVWSDSTHAPDVYTLDLRGGRFARLTQSMLGGIKPEALSKAELVQYKSFDDRIIHALYLRPSSRRLGDPPPLVVLVHGGPDWQIYDDWYPDRQALAEAGFAVLAPNFRGSSGFGGEFQAANRKDWGGADRKDLIAGVKWLAKKKEVDPKRVGVTGGSYGGYMTLISLAKNRGEWKAGVELYGMPDLVKDYELTKDRFGDWYETQMGNPTADAKLFADRSAINFLDDMKAPLLIIQGANDTNVPLAESRLIYDELKKRGAPVEIVVYPDEGHDQGHGFARRKNRIDYATRLVGFFKKTL